MAGAGGVRVRVGFDANALDTSVSWTDVTALRRNLVAGYDFERGRDFELDFTDTGSYSIAIIDPDGILDPTNSSGPLYGKIEPDLPVEVDLWNPVASTWNTRFRGWIEDWDIDLHPSQQVQFAKITCYDIFALLTTIEMQPGQFGDPVPTVAAGGSPGTIFFDDGVTFQDRINQVGVNAIGTTPWDYFSVVFSGNVMLLEHVLSPGQNPMDVIQVACDAEFPGVSNVYPDRFGRLAAHGRLAKFDPHGTWVSIGADDATRDAAWRFRQWKLGDDAAAIATPSTYARMGEPFSWNRGRSKIINSALAYPKDISPADIDAQYVSDPTSLGLRGYGSWSKENLLTASGTLTGNTGNEECKAFAQFYVNNYAEPRHRITALTCKTVLPTHRTAAETWAMLCEADIADTVEVTVSHPGGGGFNLEPFYIEGVRESASPLRGDFPMVVTTYDVSPAAYFTGDLAGLDGS